MLDRISPSWLPWAAGILVFCALYAVTLVIGRLLGRRKWAGSVQTDAVIFIETFGSNAYEEALQRQRQAQSGANIDHADRSPRHWELVRLEIRRLTSRKTGKDTDTASSTPKDSVTERKKPAEAAALKGTETAGAGRDRRPAPERAAIGKDGEGERRSVSETTGRAPLVHAERSERDAIDAEGGKASARSSGRTSSAPLLRTHRPESGAIKTAGGEAIREVSGGLDNPPLAHVEPAERRAVDSTGEATTGGSGRTNTPPPIPTDCPEQGAVDATGGKATNGGFEKTSTAPLFHTDRRETGAVKTVGGEATRDVSGRTDGAPLLSHSERSGRGAVDLTGGEATTDSSERTSTAASNPADRRVQGAFDVAEGATTQDVSEGMGKAPFAPTEPSERSAIDAVEGGAERSEPPRTRVIALAHVDRPGIEDRLGVHFPMMYRGMSVRVLVTRLALAGNRVPLEGSYLARFERDRELFETVAREKFNPDWPVAKITITQDDMLGASSSPTALLREAVLKASEPRGSSATLFDKFKTSNDE